MYNTQPQPKKKNGCLIAGLIGGGVFLILAIIFFAVIIAAIGSLGTKSNEYVSPTYSGNDGYVAVLFVEGTIASSQESGLLSTASGYNHSYLMNTVDRLSGDANNKGILLYIDSPGGEVYATDELYVRLMNYKKITGRPVYAYCASMAASGGYYLAACADKILMNRNCTTGSIGVTAGTYIDISGFLEKNGIKTTSIYVGKNKTMGSYFDEFTQEQQFIYYGILMETYDQFVNIVAEGRDLSIDETERLADGRIYSPKQALELGLIDAIVGYDEAIQTFRSDMDWSQSTQFLNFRYEPQVGISDLFLLFRGKRMTDLETYLSYAENPVEGFAYYYEGLG
jgi:protease-4